MYKTMNREEANRILNNIREGQDYPLAVINLCLDYTGDRAYAPMRSTGMEGPLPQEDWRSRLRSRAIMVGASRR
jgi:hypothetical protein